MNKRIIRGQKGIILVSNRRVIVQDPVDDHPLPLMKNILEETLFVMMFTTVKIEQQYGKR